MAQMRGPFPLPQSGPQISGNGCIITLLPGGMQIVPQGEYLVTCGGQTCIQWMDPMNAQWRSVYPPGSIEQISSDGTNYRLINLSGVCVGANITNAGSGGVNGIGPVQTGSTVTFGAPAAGGVTATAQGYVVVGGSVPAPTVTQGGSQFLVPPVVACDPPPLGGVQATFTATLSSAGVVTGITQVNPGAGYVAVPNFYVIPQPMFYQGAIRYPGDSVAAAISYQAAGLINQNNVWAGSPFQANINNPSGVLLTPQALTGSGTLTAVVMTYYGAGYTAAAIPSVTFGGTSLGAAAATAVMSMCLTGTSVTLAGTAFTVGNPMVTGDALIVGSLNNTVFLPRPGRGIITNTNGTFSIEDPGFGFQKAIGTNYGTLLNGAAAPSAPGGTLPAASQGGITDWSVLQPMVQ